MSEVRRDWEELGDVIEEIIDNAVRSRNYQKLNQTITEAVNTGAKAVREAVEAGRKPPVVEQAPPYKSYPNYNPTARTQYPPRPRHPQQYQTNKNIYSSKLGTQRAPAQQMQQAQPQQNLPVLYRSTSGKMAGGIVMTVGGGLVTFGTSLDLLATAIIRGVVTHVPFLSVSTVLLMMGLTGGAALLASGIRTICKVNRFDKYVRVLGQKTYCTLEQLARSVGKPLKFVRKEIPKMIEEGLFLEGHIDAEQKGLITSNETYMHYEQARRQLEERKRQDLLEEQRRAAAPKLPAEVREVLDKGDDFIRQIRACNDAIPGQEISEKITRMENIVRRIFQRAEAHPEIVPDLKKLMDYYLPMTIKLLNAYADMDAQPVQGETIQNSKREIEATLDTLNQAFERLLDSVFRDTAMDVSSDISVLQTLLAQEGLADDDLAKLRTQNQRAQGPERKGE